MANVSQKHPEKEQLVAFGVGKLEADEAEQIAQHLDSCQDCSETILNLQDDTFVALVRNLFAPESSRVALRHHICLLGDTPHAGP